MFEHVRRERAIQNLPRKKTGSELDVEHEDLPYIAETQERIGEVIRNTHAHLLIDQEEEGKRIVCTKEIPVYFNVNNFILLQKRYLKLKLVQNLHLVLKKNAAEDITPETETADGQTVRIRKGMANVFFGLASQIELV